MIRRSSAVLPPEVIARIFDGLRTIAIGLVVGLPAGGTDERNRSSRFHHATPK
jgi:hypothetical protein